METLKMIKNIFVVLLALGIAFILLGYLKSKEIVEAPEKVFRFRNMPNRGTFSDKLKRS
jgi:hypothetical protein